MKRFIKLLTVAALLATPVISFATNVPASELPSYSATALQAAAEHGDQWVELHRLAALHQEQAYTASLNVQHTASAGGFNLYFIFAILLLAVTSRALRQ